MKFLLVSMSLSFLISTAAVADDCQFIRDALSGTAPGAEVVVPAGAYVCGAPIVLDRNGVTLSGASGGVTLKLADNTNTPLIIIGHTVTPPPIVKSVRVMNFILDGNMANQQIECWGGPCDSGGTAYIRNNGISVRNAHDSLIENVKAFHHRSGGLVTERGTRRLTVRNYEGHDNFFDGLAGYETEQSVFENVYLHHNRYAGISVDLHFNYNHFKDANVSANGDVGIYARWGIGNTFDRMSVEGNGNHGIYLAHDGNYSRCPLNYGFTNTQVKNNKGWGLWFNDQICDGTTFTDSLFAGNGAGCYMVPEGAGVSMTNVSCQ